MRISDWSSDVCSSDLLFLGALAHRHPRRLELEGNEVVGQEELLAGLGERIRDVRSGPDGFLYVLTDSDDGRLLRLEPAGPQGAAHRRAAHILVAVSPLPTILDGKSGVEGKEGVSKCKSRWA